MKSVFIRNLLVLSVAATATIGCATQQTAQLTGGAAVEDGSGRTVTPTSGSSIGALVGGQIGSRMDERDLQQASLALENSRTDRSIDWVNPDTGYQYSVRPTHTYQAATGPCRNYTMRAVIDGRNETVFGTACRQADGTWR